MTDLGISIGTHRRISFNRTAPHSWASLEPGLELGFGPGGNGGGGGGGVPQKVGVGRPFFFFWGGGGGEGSFLKSSKWVFLLNFGNPPNVFNLPNTKPAACIYRYLGTAQYMPL